MKHRWLGILLIASFAFWATGVAHWAHEALKHDDLASHSHHGCTICKALSTMTVERGGVSASVEAHALSPHTLRLIQFAPRVICVAWLEPACGPPPAAPALAA